MEKATDTQETATTRLLAGLNGRGIREAPEMAARVEDVLAHAALAATPGGDTRLLDDRVIEALVERSNPDPVLDRLDLELFAGLLDRIAARIADAGDEADSLRRRAWSALDLVRRPAILRRIDPGEREAWAGRILALVEGSRFTVGPLFRQRAELYGSKPLFELSTGGRHRLVSWREAASRVESLSRALLSLADGGSPPRIALLSENRLEMALLDLACLTSSIVNVLVPANATESDVGYILRHSGAGVVIVSGPEQLRKVLPNRDALAAPAKVIVIDAETVREPDVDSFEELMTRAPLVPRSLPRERSEASAVSDLATVMYTSGTTGMPKGIRFSYGNIVFKRFARALALPEIGEDDVFLCYLPLFHTFGRFLELMGCVFWGARYCFLAGTSADALVRGMRHSRPSVFISVPKKWIQLHEAIARRADPLKAGDEELLRAVEHVTGGRLRWGLSAAGHLDAEIFRFFAANGVELMSGFGMTEATGGITMTAPGEYRDGSLGLALPGIELRLVEDGELLIRGPYVMLGYHDPPDGESGLDEQGWLRSGDLMETDDDGHLRLVDRKKEIYKNLQGQTIAPQRIENHFRDFESVGRAFLVGDHREYNTLLIHPNPDYEELDFGSAGPVEVQEHFSSLVVSVNKFLAPYERIVDFAIIDRDLDADRGELTPKGTPRRKNVEKGFADVVQGLYRRASLHVGGVDLTLPNWLFQILGITARDIRSDGDRITLPASGSSLTVRARDEKLARVGSCLYRHERPAIDLGKLLTAPPLWLGNEELVGFVALDTTTRQRQRRAPKGIEWAGRVEPHPTSPEERERLVRTVRGADIDLLDIDLAARMLGSDEEPNAVVAVESLAAVLRKEESPLHSPVRLLLERQMDSPHRSVRRRAFQVLVPAVKEPRFRDFVWRFLSADTEILDAGTREALCERSLSPAKLEAFIDVTRVTCEAEMPPPSGGEADAPPPCHALLDLLAAYGAGHPIGYRRLRAFLERVRLFAPDPRTREHAHSASQVLAQGFRQWLGATARIAVDPETGQEYRWDEVVVFGDDVPDDDRRRLLSALTETAMLREGVFLFSNSASVRLSDIPPGGVWIRLLGSRHGKSVYRMTIQTRYSGSYDIAVNVNHDLSPEDVREEIRWLILSGDPGIRNPLVEDFGGYWPKQDLWSEEFIAGETLYRSMRRMSRRDEGAERLKRRWPFFAWATLSAYVDFWYRSGKRLEISNPDMTNIVVPIEDYLTGARIVSLTRRRPHEGLMAMLRAYREEFIAPAEEQYAVLSGLVGWDVLFSSVLEVVGEADGLTLFREALERESPGADDEMAAALESFVDRVQAQGFVPMRLHFAIARYCRWASLNADPTPAARAETLMELYETYGLRRLADDYPESRVRFFIETVLREASAGLLEGLWEIVRSMRETEFSPDALIDAVDALRAKQSPARDQDYFLTRLSYPYLQPEAAADFVRSHLGGKRQSEIVVTLDDNEGRPFRVRHALNPKEVERLLRLFLAAKLDVRFRMEHRHLVAINERGQIIGGIYYEIDEEMRSAHLEKIVVADHYRRKGVADGLMNEFFNRLRAASLTTVTTGFFRPWYFYGYGFAIEKRYAGLVKSLVDEPDAEAAELPRPSPADA